MSTGTISLAFDRREIDHPLNGFGIVIPRSERRRINAVTWTSTKFMHRAPQGRALLRVFFGGSRTPQMFDKGDEELQAIVLEELGDLMGIDAQPLFTRIYRWPRANAQYDVNHLERLGAIESALPPGILLAGSPYRGIGLPDCVHQGEQASRSAAALVLESAALEPQSAVPNPQSELPNPQSGGAHE